MLNERRFAIVRRTTRSWTLHFFFAFNLYFRGTIIPVFIARRWIFNKIFFNSPTNLCSIEWFGQCPLYHEIEKVYGTIATGFKVFSTFKGNSMYKFRNMQIQRNYLGGLNEEH